MFKTVTLAALTLATLTMAPLAVMTGPANAQEILCKGCKEPQSSTQSCSAHLGYLRRVYEEDLGGVEDPNRVFVIPVCVNDHMMRSDGNAGALLGAIAANDALVDALFQKGYRHEDVVAIRMTGEESLNLYVVESRY